MSMESTSLFLLSTLAFLLSSCAGSSHPRLVTPSEGPISPRYLEIYSELHAATLHFPAGVYSLNAVDKIGYYYRAAQDRRTLRRRFALAGGRHFRQQT